MKKREFIEKLKEALEVDGDTIDGSTNLTELEEFDSLAIMSLIALVDEYFGRTLSQEEFQKITTIQSFMDIIGEEYFEYDLSII
jgi:acyl carrier protein